MHSITKHQKKKHIKKFQNNTNVHWLCSALCNTYACTQTTCNDDDDDDVEENEAKPWYIYCERENVDMCAQKRRIIWRWRGKEKKYVQYASAIMC